VADPLAGLTGPTTAGLTNYGSVSYSNGAHTLNPGIYSRISASGNASLTLSPGVYLLEGGGLTVTGNASVAGSGVTLYNTSSNYPSATGSYGGTTLSGNGSFNLTAPTGGPYAGVVIFQAHANTRAVSLSGNAAAGLSGTVYAPAALLYVSGNASVSGALDVNELALSGNAASTQVADGGDVSGGSTAGQLLAGDLEVYVNDPAGLFTADELARIQDAVNAVDAVVAPYGVTVSETTDPSLANVVVDTGGTSAAGGYADGVLGCYSTAGEITLIQGWDWYAGADPTQIGADQYDFQTTVTHELGHALGLGESDDPTSAMYGTLTPATAIRRLTTADLSIPYSEAGADAQRAALLPTNSADASPALTQEVTPTASVLPAVAVNGPKVVILQSARTNRAEVSLAELPGGGPASPPLNRQPDGTAPVGLLAADGDVSLPTLPTALAARMPQPAMSGVAVRQDDSGSGADAPLPSAPSDPSLPDCPEPAGQHTTRAALPSASAEWRAEPRASTADGFFQATGRRAGGLIRPGTEAGQANRPAPRDVAAAGPLLFTLLGSTWAVRDEETESRRARRPRRG
jgi:hypothetical protein